MKKSYNIPCFDSIHLVFAPLINDKASLLISKIKKIEKTVVNEEKEATIMNKLYNLRCFDGILPISGNHVDDRTSLSKSKRKIKFESQCYQRK